MKDLKTLLTSKKFLTAVLTVLLMVLAEFGFNLDIETALAIVSPLLAYILGQGIADNGKERAKVENGK
jgi:hypothetical protein